MDSDRMETHQFRALRPSAVIKLGGSLLDLSDIASRLEHRWGSWGRRPLLVAGGGEAADLVRLWDRRFQLGEQSAHWLALDSLELTARLVERLWPRSLVASLDQVEPAWKLGRIPIICPREWFERASLAGLAAPPQTWDTTTDTIAAWVAGLSQAEECWLCKSVSAPCSLQAATEGGLVDSHFPEWITTPLKWVNLRTDGEPMTVALSRSQN